MKKALVILMALAMTFAAFADAPVAVCDITTFSGNASVTWGMDLDSGKTGFKNDTQVTFVFDIFSKGLKGSEGEGVWGDIAMGIRSWEDNAYWRDWYCAAGTAPTLNMPAIQLDHAIIHFNDFYIGIAAGDTKVGNLEILQAVSSDNGNYKINDVGADKDQGITLGYANDLFGIDVDVRSKAAATQYTDDYAFAAQADIKAVANLTLNGGIAYDEEVAGIFGKVVYDLAIDDTFYLKPQVGFSKDASDAKLLSAGLFFGWNKAENQDTNIYFIDKDVSNGFSVATQKDLDADALPLTIGLWDSATLVPNLTFGAEFKTADITADALNADVIAEVKYDINGIVPKFGLKTNLADNSPLNVKAGVEFNGFIANTNFSVDYASGDLAAATPGKGTIGVTAKVSF